MAAPVPLREDYDAGELRRLARSSSDPGQVRRLLAVAAVYAGEARSAAAVIGGVGLQTVRDWVLRFNAQGPAGLATGRRQVSGPGSTRPSARPCGRSSMRGRTRRCTGWCAGGSPT